MALNEDKYRKIQEYLDQDMNEQEARAFEQELRVDQELAQELKLHREMENLLADSPENALRKNLDLLSEDIKEETPPPRSTNRFFWLLLPVVLALSWWLWKGNPTTSTLETDPPTQQLVPPNNEEEQIIPNTEDEQDSESQPQRESTPPPRPERDAEKEEAPPRAIAANFTPNPALEFLIENNLRDNDISVKLDRKQENVQLNRADETTKFEVVFELQSREGPTQQDFKLHLFSNDRQAFEDFSPLFTNEVEVVPLEADVYRIDFEQTYPLQPGLYYYVLEDVGTEKIYLVDKFEVR